MRQVVGRLTRVWNPSPASRALQAAIAGGNWRLHAQRPSGVSQGRSHRRHDVSGVNDGPFGRWTLTFEGFFQEQAAGQPRPSGLTANVDARVLTELEALGFLLRAWHICAKPGADPER
jgi:hypothetical protein